MAVRNMADGSRVKNCSFDLHSGEVLGIAGLVGAGRTELARLIFGADPRISGTVEVEGAPVTIRTPLDAINAGIIYLTEDRKGKGLFLDASVLDNINLCAASMDAKRGGRLDRPRARQRAEAAIKNLGIRVPNLEGQWALCRAAISRRSCSRLLEIHPQVLILDEPTRGVDIGAKSEIYRLINELAAKGFAIIVISSELPEIVGTADRCW